MSETKSQIKVYRTEGYRDPQRAASALLIVPDRLPIKLTVRGIRVLIGVGEFAFIPEGEVYTVNSSPERDIICFDMALLSHNPEFTLLLPVLTLPYICRPKPQKEESPELAFGCISPILMGSDEAEKPATAPSVTPLDLAKQIIASEKYNGDTPALSTFFLQTGRTSMLYALFTLIGREITSAFCENMRSFAEASEIFSKLSAAISFINRNYMNEISLSETAKEAGYNHTYLSHIFKTYYGFALNDYLTGVRVKAAAASLVRENEEISEKLPMQEIALRSGFLSSTTFNRSFRTVTGCSPRDYAKLPSDF